MRQCVGIQRRALAPSMPYGKGMLVTVTRLDIGERRGQMTASTKPGRAKQAPLVINPGGCQGQAVGRSPEI